MRLPPAAFEIETAVAEFDAWITPSLGSIQQTDKFRLELDAVVRTFDVLAEATDKFEDPSNFDPMKVAEVYDKFARSLLENDRRSGDDLFRSLRALASTMYLVTGKSDNNVKCQLPIHLVNTMEINDLLEKKRSKSSVSFLRKSVPRTLKADKYMSLIRALYESSIEGSEQLHVLKLQDDPKRLLEYFLGFVLSDSDSVSQLWSLGKSYCALRDYDGQLHRALLTPLVIFQVRGSVAASGGHEPERLLRERMAEWGLRADIDFNNADVEYSKLAGNSQSVEINEESGVSGKTRAYDFILPYQTRNWTPRLFIQCQFYGGDSGSVSHKNVDQTTTSRQSISSNSGDAIFVEYVDGAGYFSSLNGDLRRILSMENTSSFFQVKTSAIRLRRELQEVAFLTPLEIEHAIMRTDASVDAVRDCIVSEGYSEEEFERTLRVLLDEHHAVMMEDNSLALSDERALVARRYFLLDIAAIDGAPIPPEPTSEFLTVPGYGPLHGIRIDRLIERAKELAPALSMEWKVFSDPMEDICWLCDRGLAMKK